MSSEQAQTGVVNDWVVKNLVHECLGRDSYGLWQGDACRPRKGEPMQRAVECGEHLHQDPGSMYA